MESSDATTIQNVWAGLGIMRKEDCKWIEKQGCSDPRKQNRDCLFPNLGCGYSCQSSRERKWYF